MALPSQEAVHRAMVAKGGLRSFVKLAFQQVEPRAYVPGWHIDAMADHLEAVTKSHIRNLVICVPPGCMKSLMTSVFWPVYNWITDPAVKTIYASYSANLSRRDAIRARDLIGSDWFQARWGFHKGADGRLDLSQPVNGIGGLAIPYQNTRSAMFYENNSRGFRFSTSVGGEVTGRHADILIADDVHKAQAALGGKAATGQELRNGVEFWTDVLSTRQANPQTTRKVIIGQRLHENDLPGKMLGSGDYHSLILPMRYSPKIISSGLLGFTDPRTAEGELLWPSRYGPDEVEALETAMGPATAAAQLGQDPTPPGGNVFAPEWLRQTYQVLPARGTLYQSWDCAFKGLDTSDYVVGQVWLKVSGGEFYLVDQIRQRLDFPATVQAVLDMRAKYPRTSAIWIEDKANGPAVISTLKKRVPGVIPVNPEGGKETRAHAIAPYFAAGNVYIPEDTAAPWVSDWRLEMLRFPRGAHDDMVDATTQALVRMAGTSGDRFQAAMQAFKQRAAR